MRTAMLILAMTAPLALAQAPKPEPAKPEPAKAEDPNVLAGPKATEPAKPASLVERGMDGQVRRLDVQPEEAALALLTLSDEQKKSTQQILTERAAIIDRVVVENVPLLLKLYTASDATDRRQLARELLSKFSALSARGPLAAEISDLLTEDQRKEFTRLVREYWDAVLSDARRQAQERGEDARAGAQREYTAAIGQAIRRSYERTIAARGQDFDALLKKLNLEPEREAKVRAIVTDYAQKNLLENKGAKDDRGQRQVFLRVLAELTPEQRQTLIEHAQAKK